MRFRFCIFSTVLGFGSNRGRCKTPEEIRHLFAAMLGHQWHFGYEDRPHFVHNDRRQWLVYDEHGQWEAWLGHELVGRFGSLKKAKSVLVSASRSGAIGAPLL